MTDPINHDPLANMPQVPVHDASTAFWKDVGKGLDNLINGIIDRIGELGGAGVSAVAGKAVDVAAGAASVVGGGMATGYNPSFSPSSSPSNSVSPSGPSQQMAVSPSLGDLGNLTPSSVPSMGPSQGSGRFV